MSSASDEAGASVAALVYQGVERWFGATHALKSLDLTIGAGRIHALVGENGAGKSTCLGLAAGRIPATSGTVRAFGSEVQHGDPRRSREAGVIAIYQELTILPEMSAEANVFLGSELSRKVRWSRREMRDHYVELAERLGLSPHPGVSAGSLSTADQQLLEIMRALVNDARIILFDEPSASLAHAEKEVLFRLMSDLRSQGVTMGFVSHDLDEVLRISDDITIFRDGAKVASGVRAEWDKKSIVDQMLDGTRGLTTSTRRPWQDQSDSAAPILRVEDLSVPGVIEDISFQLREREIVGLAGLMGSGRTTVLRALAGMEPRASGRLWLNGVEKSWPRSAPAARRLGIALIPEDRRTQGLVMMLDAASNVVLSNLAKVATKGFLRKASARAAAARVAAPVGLPVAFLERKTEDLSGGNQQKLLLARWLHSRPTVLLTDEPTRGVDIGASREILDSLEELAGDGVGVIIVSSDLEELEAIADTVIVLSAGAAVGELVRGRDVLTPEAMLQHAFGVIETPIPPQSSESDRKVQY